MLTRRFILKATALSVALAMAPTAFAADTIKVGVLHSLSGTMAISETSLKDMALFAIDEINAKGGVLGKKLEPVVVDPASNWPLFAEKARQLLTKDKVAVTFGCWTSVSRKSVLPVYEELNGLLFYPVQYEGEELSPNVFYTGAAPNQQAIPAVEYLMSKDGGGAKRFFLLTDVAGVLDKQGDLVTDLTPGDVATLRADGTISGGMLPKIENALAAVDAGVSRVIITLATAIDGKHGTTIQK
jgi:urea transport system substrate-binding protein